MDYAGIDVRRLKYFIAVCNNGGFSRASNVIGIAQPALTRQVKLLEKEIGLPLVIRTGRGAEPTAEGKFLLARSVEHLEGLDNIVKELKQKYSQLSGQAVLGICPTIAPFFLEKLQAHIRANCPNVLLSVIEAYSGDLKNLIVSDRLDLALTYRPSGRNGLAYTELFSERLVLVAGYAPEMPIRPYRLKELSGLRLILPSRIHELRLIIDRVCRLKSVSLKPELELDSLEAVKSLLLKKPLQYYTILPAYCVSNAVEQQQYSQFEIAEKEMIRTIAVVTPRHSRNPTIASFIERHIREQAELIKSKTASVF
ncbi:MAG TPA: LysR family transcriptional regulator [Verrucomicrobiae bacterium]|nr:LysR family transcriptional regulator [Verrucomicrobiae bacterium]